MRKAMLAAGVTVAAVALLAGCSSNTGSGSDTTADHNLSASISYAFWDANQKPAMDKLISDFNKEYPKITVTEQVTPYQNYFTKLQTQGSSKTLPDVFWMNGPNFQLYASNGLLEPVSSAVQPSNYPAALNELYSYDGKQYGAPKDFDTIAVYYNKAVFDKAGVAYPTADWTWDEFHQKAKAISDKLKSEGVYGVASGLSGGQEVYYNTIFQAGGSVVSKDGKKSGYDSAESIKGLQFVRDLIADGSSPTPSQLSDTPQDQWFINSKSAMIWSGTWLNSELLKSPIKDTIALAPLPKGEKNATVIHGLANVVAKDSKNKAAAVAFQNYLAGKQAAQTQAEMGAANPAFNGTQEAFVKTAPWDLNIFEKAAADYSYPYPISKNTAAWNKLENDLLPDAFDGKRPVAEVAKQLATEMNAALAKE
ncbi:ABC transporter substrate-binding protein [Leifsonia poae]|uniref:ABC transporter substrate-binding protein n=1 Tax=Leifsonia poae TaxID=110933 RepID=UPI001CC14EB6|nr:sugar ABC transporter substrate-binding protein [Leifsonia poae]